ncbi:WXG100 family type VII secretion target [Streptomyces sp. NPDC127112]|uniref:WXG100 family type VII secretion target n=1 Tax=Streptomyces sp. NPDC127112 TaxID=3345364 RepID=UPI0036274661
MATTNFEGYSHEQLLAMIASLDPETVKARATQLADAAIALNEIGDSLKRHEVKGWEGEAAHAFQDWVSRAGSATLTLGKYSDTGSQWMQHVAQTMVEVQANTPKYDKGAAENLEAARKYHNDPDAQQVGQTAHAKLTADHEQAVQQLTKLAQSYDWSATQLTSAEPPTFSPPSPDFDPPVVGDQVAVARPAGGSASGSDATGHSYIQSTSGGGVSAHDYIAGTSARQSSSDVTLPATAGPMAPPIDLPDGRGNVDLDHVATLPDRSLPAPVLPGGPAPSIPGGGWSPPIVPLPPLTLPPTTGPVAGPRPSVGLGGKVGGIAVPPPRDAGIVGGRPISTGSPNAGIPRGTVIGAEGLPAAGGRPVPGMMGGGFGGPHGPSGSPATGRRLAGEPGGILGGRQAASGSQPFTQGGSGLVRSGSGGGAMGHASAASPAPGRRRGEQGGTRPDYLAEDEETWQDNRRVVPPVID